MRNPLVPKLSLPVLLFLAAAFLSFVASVTCWFLVDQTTGLYIGLWVPSILSLGALLNSLPRRERPAANASSSSDKAA